ncbi:UvrABC system protein A [Phycisphaerae bacterium RAS1]|nr:UvrABC system protein A [Phycisphaerae bacterium RAS1]
MASLSSQPIRVAGARVHNLRDVSLTLPRNKLICFTGVSGSGKSSLAFDTLYAEGQRRYIESLSSYARQFMGQLPKPDVDQITGLSPSISIQQKTSGWNPRSTVGTITQIYDYARVLFARAGTPHCTRCGREIAAQTREQMLAQILALGEGTACTLLSPKVRAQKGEHRDLFAELLQQGFARARVDGVYIHLSDPPPLDRNRRHHIEVVIDRVTIRRAARGRLAEALELALAQGDGVVIVCPSDLASDWGGAGVSPAPATPGTGKMPVPPQEAVKRGGAAAGAEVHGAGRDILLSAGFACSDCGVSFEPPDPQLFSFNSPQGMCARCDGLGTSFDFDPKLLIPDSTRSFLSPCIVALRRRPGKWPEHIYRGVARHIGFDLDAPWDQLPEAGRQALLYGTDDAHLTFEWKGRFGVWRHGGPFEGVIADLRSRYRKSASAMVRRFYEQFMRVALCGECGGARLRKEALAVTLTSRAGGGTRGAATLNIVEASRLPIRRALEFFDQLDVSGARALIAEEPLKEIRARLRFLLDVGLDYLTLDRAAPTLSGGESQRIRLASQIGCGLTGVLYVLDEPSIGLHPRDNRRLLASLQRLRDLGNTVIVVEHDHDTMLAADWLVDFGPGPGVRGGRVVAQGRPQQVCEAPESLTGAYLAGRRKTWDTGTRRPIRKPSRR